MTTENIAPLKGRARLDAARAAAADLAARRAEMASMTDGPVDQPRPIRYVEPGTVVHALISGLTVDLGGLLLSSSVVVERGRQFVVTSEMIEKTRNRLGQLGGVALAADEDEQIRRYGKVLFRVGETPDDMRSWLPGSVEWAQARERARREAWSAPTDAEKAYQLALVEKEFGPAPETSVTTNRAPHPSIREAELQQQRLANRAGRGEL